MMKSTHNDNFSYLRKKKPFENIVGKGENAGNLLKMLFPFSNNVSYPIKDKIQYTITCIQRPLKGSKVVFKCRFY